MPLTYLLIGKKISKLEKPSGNQADKHIIVRSCVIIVAVLTGKPYDSCRYRKYSLAVWLISVLAQHAGLPVARMRSSAFCQRCISFRLVLAEARKWLFWAGFSS